MTRPGGLTQLVLGRVERLLARRRFVQFTLIGALGALTDNFLLVLLVELAGFAPTVAAVGSKEASILLMFGLNEAWTFAEHRESEHRGRATRLVKSHAVRAGGAAIGIAVLYGCYQWLGMWYVLANVVGIGVGFAFNYTFESLFTWNVTGE